MGRAELRHTNGSRNGSNGGGPMLAVAATRVSNPSPGKSPALINHAIPPPGRGKWPLAIAGGFLFGGLVLGALAWIQPGLRSDQRVELPAAVRLVLSNREGDKRQAKKQEARKEEKKEPKEAPRSRPKQAPTQAKRVVQARQAAPPPKPEMSALKNVSLFQGIGGGPGGLVLNVADLRDEEGVKKAKDIAKYEERRRAIREAHATGRSGGSARQGRQLIDINVSQPKEVDQPKPKYPPRALKEQVEGFVRVRLLISTTGRVERSEVVAAQPEGYFEESILAVLPSWQFTPAVDEAGRPIECSQEYNYVFKLEDAGI